jgi:hypothetical protein
MNAILKPATMNDVSVKLMEDNLEYVWSEKNPVHRLRAMESVYAKDSVLYHVNDKTEGHEAINESVTNTLHSLPANFVFTKLKPVIINNNIGRLIWGIGPKGMPPVGTGMDIAVIENNRIKALYVFLDV